jgi:F-type H+-transporting ATPase subunit b|tara:strand:+ start:5546 stop:6043 length:498 start_codon:yes stop_codon:yes gene_type:complete
MSIDATFWVAIAFFIFFGGLFYLKVPQKVNTSLNEKINIIKKELKDSEKLKNEAKSLLSDYENKLDKSKKESRLIIETAKKESEKNILERTKKFHQLIEDKKINTLTKITQMKENALREIKNISINISIQSVENIIKNSIDKNKLDKLYASSLEEIKKSLKETKA